MRQCGQCDHMPPAEVPVVNLAPLKPGTAVLLIDQCDDHQLKKGWIVSKVHPVDCNNPHVNEYVVSFTRPDDPFLTHQKVVKEAFLVQGGDVMPTHEWRFKTIAERVRARRLETKANAAA